MTQIPTTLLLIMSMAVALGGGVIKNFFCIKFSNSSADRQTYNCLTSLTAAVILVLWGGVISLSLFTLFLGMAFGILTALQQISNLKAMEQGPWSYTSVIISLSTLIPTLSGMMFWNERISWPQVIGIILMVGCLILSVDFKPNQKKASFQWLFYCLIAFVCTGLIGVMQKWHQNTDSKSQLNAFLIIAFLVSSLYSAISYYLLQRKTKGRTGRSLINRLPVLLMIFGGICTAVNNKLNLFLSGVMESAVFFPIVNGGGLILVILTAVFVFKERLTFRQWLGLTLGILSVVFLCNPFS